MSVSAYNIDTLAELNNDDVVVMGTSQSKPDLNAMAPALRQWVEAGHGVVATGWSVYYAGVSSSGGAVSDIDAIVPIMLTGSYQYNYYPTVTITNSNHPVTYGVSSFSNNYNYAEYSSSGADVGATVLGTVDGYPAVIDGNPGLGRGVHLGPVYPYYSWGSGDADHLLENAMAWAAFGGRDQVDQFLVPVVASDNLTIKTTNPGDGPFVRVAPVTGNGECTLSEKGASGTANSQLEVTSNSIGE